MVRRIVPLMALMLVVSISTFAAGPPPAHGVVNINTATVEQLTLLPRVGPSLARRIVQFRKGNGAFKAVDELVAVRGIGEKSLATLKPYLTITGPTTLEKKVRPSRRSHTGGAKKTN